MAGKKGSQLVEASILFPVVILTIVSLLSFGAALYEGVAGQTGESARIREDLLSKGPLDRDEDLRIRLRDAWSHFTSLADPPPGGDPRASW